MANTSENANLCGLNRKDFQTTINGKKTDLYILKNRKGYEVAISNYGGAIVSIMVPDKDGNVANVIQGHANIEQLMSGEEPYLSTLITICMEALRVSTARYGMPVRWVPARWRFIVFLLMVKKAIPANWTSR